MADKNMKKILGALIVGIVATNIAATNPAELNLSALMRLFLGLIGWIPMAYVLSDWS